METLQPLAPADIPEVMRLERLPGYEAYIGRWEADAHAAEMASPDARYFGVRDGARLTGFVILQAFREPQVRLRRIALQTPGGGLGGRILREIMDWVFETTPAEAFWLDVHVDNARAQRVYEREGLTPQGMFDGMHRRMAIPRARWMELSRR
ncbi:MAG: GNAT family N-acetyltransferase [Phenylobacterium sp.]|uniref:GNAT family N-acetyltransferase n=1 Tax=Phenylobacterium sp. TaxID=1871053 RepID=UPI0025F05DDA|nr:GNAT family N-acetyltransferase [Phenylobacterium sp.]MBI1199423.1 GNAT family N-acetyltransferase [Phenylobacterium sp.]